MIALQSLLPKIAPSGGSLALVGRLIRENARDYTVSYAFAFAFMGLAAAATGASAWIIRDVINRIFIDRDSGMIGVVTGAVILIYAVKGFAGYGSDMILNRIGNNIVARTQKRIYRHLLTL